MAASAPGEQGGVKQGRGRERQRVLPVLLGRQQAGEDIDRAEADQALDQLNRQVTEYAPPEHRRLASEANLARALPPGTEDTGA
jgi:hypothetical protein